MARKNDEETLVVSEVPEQEGLKLVKKNLDGLRARKIALANENAAIDAKIDNLMREIRGLLPQEEEEEETEKPEKGRRRRRTSGSMNMAEYTLKAFKQAGDRGLSRKGAAMAIKKLGFQSNASTDEIFISSVYVSGINKLMKQNLVEYFKDDNGGKYRLTEKGKNVELS